jgi:hypothetical protein
VPTQRGRIAETVKRGRYPQRPTRDLVIRLRELRAAFENLV